MVSNILENILKDTLTYYLGLDDSTLEKHIISASTATNRKDTQSIVASHIGSESELSVHVLCQRFEHI